MIAHALRLHGHARAIIADGAPALASLWHLQPGQCQLVIEQLALAVGPAERADAQGVARIPISGPRPSIQPFSQGVHLFHAALAQGMPIGRALRVFGTLGDGAYSHDDRCFFPLSAQLGPVQDRVSRLQTASRLMIRGSEGEKDLTAGSRSF